VRLMKAGAAVLVGAVLAGGGAGTAPAVSELVVRQRTNANASLAAAGSIVAVAWGANDANGVTDVYAAASADGGRAFGSPVRVNRVAGEARLSGEQPARVALVPRPGRTPSIVVVWTAKGAQGTRLLSSRSDDGGKTFAQAAALPGSDASGNRGWESIAVDRDGRVVAVWLDHRETAAGREMNHAGHQHGASGEQRADGAARAQQSKLFFGRLDEAAGAQAVTGGVCYCCKTSVAAGRDGAVYAAWRHVYSGNVRDIAFTMSADGGRTFAPPLRVSDDNWVLDGCPENGPSLAVEGSGRVHVVWPTLVPGRADGDEATLALFYATSADGRRFTARQPLPTEGFPRHPQIALSTAGEPTIVWDEQVGGVKRIALARGRTDSAGVTRFARRAAVDAAPAAYPVVAMAEDAAVVAWVSGPGADTVIRVERLAR
jgi:hypothetical protein